MSKQFSSSIAETNYPGKNAELKAEKEEKKAIKEEYFMNNTESDSDYNAIKAAEGRSPLGENNYNSPESEQALLAKKKTFKTEKDVLSENNEEEMINKIDERLEQEKASLAVIDKYGHIDLIERIFATAQAKGGQREINNVLDRTSIFIKQYQKLLGKHLSEGEEAKRVDSMFKEIMGEVAYIKDENGERIELLPNSRGTQDAIKGRDKGDKIYYEKGGKNSRAYLSQAEANEAELSRKEAAKGNNYRRNSNGLNTVFSGLARELQAFNPFTGKKESIDKRNKN